MGKTSRTKSKEKRKEQKRARKNAQKALYESYMKQGKNTKSKRSTLNNKRKAKAISVVSHPDGACGNPGCAKCFGVFFGPFLCKGKAYRMPQWMFMKWDSLTKEERKSINRKG